MADCQREHLVASNRQERPSSIADRKFRDFDKEYWSMIVRGKRAVGKHVLCASMLVQWTLVQAWAEAGHLWLCQSLKITASEAASPVVAGASILPCTGKK